MVRLALLPSLLLLSISSSAALCWGAEASEGWNQWRGPSRNGLALSSPPLIEELPAGGLEPLWESEEIPSGGNGGWGSPVAADGRVYLFAHTKTKVKEGEVPERKFPWLPPDKRVGMSDKEYAEYEVKRRDEEELRASYYDFREYVYCLDAESGKTLWKNEQKSYYCRFLQSGSPAVINGKLYILGAGRRARCLDAAGGRDLWATRLPGEFRDEYMMSSFALADGAAVVLCGHLFGLDAESGELLWEGDENETSGTHTSPVVWRHGGDEYILANVAGDETACFHPRTGKQLWRISSEANLSTPVVVGDLMITLGNSRKKGLRCFELSTGGASERWVYQRIADKGASPVVMGDYVYVQGERRLACVDLKTGRDTWSTTLDLENPQYTSLAAADGKVLYSHNGLLMFAATPEEFRPLIQGKFNKEGLLASEAAHRKLLGLEEVSREPGGQEKAAEIYQNQVGKQGPLRCASPAISGGFLYLRTNKGIACYDIRKQGT